MKIEKQKKDLKFLESEFLTYIVANYFLSENLINLKIGEIYYKPINALLLKSEEESEKVSIETTNIDMCRELYSALKVGKKVFNIQLALVGKDIELHVTIKTAPLRVAKIDAPKSIAEDEYDRCVERVLYIESAYEFFDSLIKEFGEKRISNEWSILIKNFREFLQKK